MTTLGPYKLVKRLATGGMAEIFLARREGPEGFSRDLVVKRILPQLAEDRAFTTMFMDEARIAARLTHPNVVQVYDFGSVDQDLEGAPGERHPTYYLAMELVRGVDLDMLIQRAAEQAISRNERGALPPHHAAKILSLVCEGLAHAHALEVDGKPAGLVHRDVTPSNVLISFDGAVKVADFGIAKAAERPGREDTRHGVVKGKYAYMSPEQARGKKLDCRSDLYNVGILLFESITGQELFPHHDYRAARMLTAAGQIRHPERLATLPDALAAVVRRALSVRPDDRFQDALALRADLEAYLRTAPEPSDALEIGRYVRELFPDVVREDARSPRAAGTVPATVARPAVETMVGPAAPWLTDDPFPGAGSPAGDRSGDAGINQARAGGGTLLGGGAQRRSNGDPLAGLAALARNQAPESTAPTRAPRAQRAVMREPTAVELAQTDPAADGAAANDGIPELSPAVGALPEHAPNDHGIPVAGADVMGAIDYGERIPGATVGSATAGRPSSRLGVALGVLVMLLAIAVGGALAYGLLADGRSPSPSRTPPGPAHAVEEAAPGEVMLASEPAGLPAYVNGTLRGQTPIVLALPSRAPQEISVRADGAAVAAEVVTLQPGEHRSVTLRAPQPQAAVLRVETTPSGAEVELDGAAVGESPLELELEAGAYEVRVSLDGYVEQNSEVTMRAGETTAQAFLLTREARTTSGRRPTGTLTIATNPWCEVFLGRRKLGTTPFSNVEIPAGRQTLTLRPRDRPERRHVVAIEAGRETRVNLVL